MADLETWPDVDDIGYEWRREQLLEQAEAPPAVVRDIQRLESERLRPSPHDLDPIGELFRRLLDLIAGECRRTGLLPS